MVLNNGIIDALGNALGTAKLLSVDNDSTGSQR
jgi:hypothetical protein